MIRSFSGAATALVFATALAVPAQAEVTETSDSHFVVRPAVDIAAAPKDAWQFPGDL